MYASLFNELEKIALQRQGEGSRGGKVIGHTQSGEPIYASQQKQKEQKKGLSTSAKLSLAGGVLGATAVAAPFAALKFHIRRHGFKSVDDLGNAVRRAQRAQDAYEAAGGFAKNVRDKGAPKHVWDEFVAAHDRIAPITAKSKAQWERQKKQYQAIHEEHRGRAKFGDKWVPPTDSGPSGGAAGFRGTASPRAAYSAMPSLKKAKTKAHAKKIFRETAMRNHPDRGGSAEKMQHLNSAWDEFRASPEFEKLAQLYGPFFNELMKIAESSDRDGASSSTKKKILVGLGGLGTLGAGALLAKRLGRKAPVVPKLLPVKARSA